MRVDFDGLEIVVFWRKALESRFGAGAKAESVLATIQTAAAIMARGAKPREKDRDLIRAIERLRNGGIVGFADAVGAIFDALAVDLIAGEVPSHTPHDLIKAAARTAGHLIGKGTTAHESLDGHDCDALDPDAGDVAAWDLRRDPQYRQGDHLPVSDCMIVSLRDAITDCTGIEPESVSRLLTRVVKAAAVSAHAKIQSISHAQAARAMRLKSIASRINGMALEIGALADFAVERRLGLAEIPDGWEDLDDESVAIAALAIPYARSAGEIDSLLTMSHEDRLTTLLTLGNRARAWLADLDSAWKAPSLSGAIWSVHTAKDSAVDVVQRAQVVSPVVMPVTQISLFEEV